ncbi:vitamin K epoxide reductase family protein [Novipirellula artificiosorum]|uniref:Vitamin K epoxide reductase family protein n=1 Tax=Novipirellula artificiosorum TaxID=2528016 RepID=A0A5C6E0V0_9BACT|nr:vitamin K epoxide reductase family protein [Novipirellula artificiosorum]TWU42345.1 Vitamin K epoxide reductase family protein [Novipirellula artificiosorum]
MAPSSLFGDLKPWPRPRVTLLLTICIAIASGASAYLSWSALTSSPIAGCGNGEWFDCGHVTSSQWSLWLGVPVSVLALGLYVTLTLGLVAGASGRFNSKVRQMGWAIVTTAALAAGITAVWFIALQLFVLEHICVYCMIAHACGLVIAVTMLVASPFQAKTMVTMSGLGFVGFAVLAVGQLFTEPPETFRIERFDSPAVPETELFEFDPPATDDEGLFEAPMIGMSIGKVTRWMAAWPGLMTSGVLVLQEGGEEKPEQRVAAVHGGTIRLAVAQWPHSGPEDAKYVFVELFDYCCSHCRHTHKAISGAKEALSGQLAVICLPVPLNSACNPTVRVTNATYNESCQLSTLAVAVWRVDSDRFSDFHNWMFEGDEIPSFAAAKAKAETIVDAEKLKTELASGVPDKYIAKHIEIYRRVGEGTIPKLMFPQTSVVGEFSSVEGLVDLIRRESK